MVQLSSEFVLFHLNGTRKMVLFYVSVRTGAILLEKSCVYVDSIRVVLLIIIMASNEGDHIVSIQNRGKLTHQNL